MRPVILALALLGCSEYDLKDRTDTDKVHDTGDDTNVEDSGDVEGDEECNGEDDDGDGDIDEGFDDVDGDGEADCVDYDCDVEIAGAGVVDLVEECVGYDPDEVSDPWSLSVEWQNTSIGSTVTMPAIGNLNDDNGDGTIGDGDTPDIVVAIYGGSSVVALHGDGSGVMWTAGGMRQDAGPSIGDVDGDGEPEVIAITSGNGVAALDGSTGTVEWTTSSTYPMLWPVTTIADVDADGSAEIIADAALLESDGTPIATLTPANSTCWRAPAVADLDLDGDMEIVLGNSVFDHNGTLLWSATGSGTSCFSAIANLDSDDEAEVIWTFGTQLLIFEHDGTLTTTATAGAYNPGPPCVGDLDGDEEPEIAAPAGNLLAAYEADGTPMWTSVISDSSGAAGCSVFDMNGDLTYEVLQADENALRVFDGTTGAVQYENTTHGSVTYFEYPAVADVDNDGSAEMVVAASGGFSSGVQGVTVFGHDGDGWPAAGPNWQVHDFAVTNVMPDSSVPTDPDPSWLVYNVFRGRAATDFAGKPDLVVNLHDECIASCEPGGKMLISYQVWNQGEGDIDAGTPLTLYAVDGTTYTALDTVSLPAIPSGVAIEGDSFEITWEDVGTDGYVLAVDDNGSGVGVVYECDETNNEFEMLDAPCGG